MKKYIMQELVPIHLSDVSSGVPRGLIFSITTITGITVCLTLFVVFIFQLAMSNQRQNFYKLLFFPH